MKFSNSPYQEERRASEQKQNQGRMEDIQAPVKGVITEQRIFTRPGGNSIMKVKVRIDSKFDKIHRSTYAVYYPLGQSAEEIYLVYGDNIVGRRCRIVFSGPRETSGTVYIESGNSPSDPEAAGNLPAFGTILAPAGSFF